MQTRTIPNQKKGACFDVREKVVLNDKDEAIARYEATKSELLQVTRWGQLAGEPPDTFVLTDENGENIEREAREGDLIKIHLPGPRNRIGQGEDWVRIEKIFEEKNRRLDEVITAMTVRPTRNPAAKNKAVAHFFDRYTTNTFLVCRHRIEVVCSIHGRNEQINTDTDWLDLLRNMLVALPAKAGLSNPHWKRLAKGLLNS